MNRVCTRLLGVQARDCQLVGLQRGAPFRVFTPTYAVDAGPHLPDAQAPDCQLGALL